MGFRVVGYVLIPQGGTVTYCSGPRTAPTPPTPLVAQGPQSGPAALPATRVLAAPQTGQSALGLAPRRICFPRTSRPRRQELGTGYRIQIREAAPSKPRRGGKAARLESEPCATYSSRRDHQHPAGRDRPRLYTPARVNPAFLLLTRG
jgi:hypothetical protein